MNIIPATKGLVGGKLRYRFHIPSAVHMPSSRTGSSTSSSDGNNNHISYVNVDERDSPAVTWVDVHGLTVSGGIAVSHLWTSRGDEGVDVEIGGDVRCILVIEKEGVFHRLCEDKFHIRYPCVLVCGCGFPDIATRALVSTLSRKYPVRRKI